MWRNTSTVANFTIRRRPVASDDDRGITPRARLPLPTGRAVVGGLLVAASALGVAAAHRSATTEPTVSWIVARRPIAAGSRITAADLALAPMTLMDQTGTRALRDPDAVIGNVALVPMERGELVQRSAIAAPGDVGDRPGRRLGLDLSPAAALGGTVEVGDRVDIVAVPDPGAEATVIASGALVTFVGGDGDRIGTSGGVSVVIDVPDVEAARRVVAAHAGAGVTLLEATTIAVGEEPGG